MSCDKEGEKGERESQRGRRRRRRKEREAHLPSTTTRERFRSAKLLDEGTVVEGEAKREDGEMGETGQGGGRREQRRDTTSQ